MNELYEKLKLRIFDYGRYPVVANENAIIDSLNVFVNEVYSKENYPNHSYLLLCERRNIYRNSILLIINDYIECKLHKFPKSNEQFQNLINQFWYTKLKNPVSELGPLMIKDLEKPEDLRERSNEEWEAKLELAQKQAEAWDGADEADIMTLYSNATAKLPRNSMRTMVSNADSSLRAMGGAEKMISSS